MFSLPHITTTQAPTNASASPTPAAATPPNSAHSATSSMYPHAPRGVSPPAASSPDLALAAEPRNNPSRGHDHTETCTHPSEAAERRHNGVETDSGFAHSATQPLCHSATSSSTPLAPIAELPPEDLSLFTHYANTNANLRAFSQACGQSLHFIFLWLDRPHIQPWIQRYRYYEDDQLKRDHLANLDTIAKTTEKEAEKRRCSTTILKVLTQRPPATPREPKQPQPPRDSTPRSAQAPRPASGPSPRQRAEVSSQGRKPLENAQYAQARGTGDSDAPPDRQEARGAMGLCSDRPMHQRLSDTESFSPKSTPANNDYSSPRQRAKVPSQGCKPLENAQNAQARGTGESNARPEPPETLSTPSAAPPRAEGPAQLPQTSVQPSEAFSPGEARAQPSAHSATSSPSPARALLDSLFTQLRTSTPDQVHALFRQVLTPKLTLRGSRFPVYPERDPILGHFFNNRTQSHIAPYTGPVHDPTPAERFVVTMQSDALAKARALFTLRQNDNRWYIADIAEYREAG